MIMLATGLRVGEMMAVRIEDIDLKERTLLADHRITRVKGEGLVRRKRTAASTKGRGVTLRLPDWAIPIIRRRATTRGGSGPLFPTSTGNWRDPVNVEHAIAKARDAAKFPWLTTHTYRKTVATLLDKGGLTAREIADQLTHRRPSMTQDVYMGRGVVGDKAAEVLGVLELGERVSGGQVRIRSSGGDLERLIFPGSWLLRLDSNQ